MTLAFALPCPIGLAIDLEKTLPDTIAPFERALVVGTDSRFSLADGRIVTDHGAKLWHIEPGFSAVFAGSVDSAERGLSALVRDLRRSENRERDFIASTATAAFRKSVPTNWLNNASLATSIILAVRQETWMGILRFDSMSGYAEVSPLQPIGELNACRAFVTEVEQRVAQKGHMPRSIDGIHQPEIVTSGESLHGVAVVALRAAIENVGQTIGGPLQTAILDASGTRTFITAAFDMGSAEASGQIALQQISARPDEVRSGTRRDRARLETRILPAPNQGTPIGLNPGANGKMFVTRVDGVLLRRG